MRQLYILRGLPGSGKSSFVAKSGLSAYTLAPDDIRLIMGGPVLNADGRMIMPMKDDAAVWKLLRETLENRMARGELLVVDATHTLPSYFHDYAKLAQKYRYKAYAVDFTDVPLEICKERNKGRVSYKIVDDSVLEKMYDRIRKLPIPKQFQILKPSEVAATLTNETVALDSYKRIHHIGDIQGCYTPLKQYFDQYPYTADEYYIFVGDLLDRGTENAEVLRYVCENFVDKPNVIFVEGNHELHLWNWLVHQPVNSREFNGRTRQQLEAAVEDGTLDKAAISRLLRTMKQNYSYTYDGKSVLVSHGGISTLPAQLKFVSADQYIRGAGNYGEVGAVDDAFAATTPPDTYQIHGHRNQQNHPLQPNDRCFNLEGKVEFGGELRVVQLSAGGFEPVEISNQSSELKLHPENAALVHQMRTNRHIAERSLPGSISSFHFKTEVFYNKTWTKQTLTARGLFVNTLTNEIVIRAYDKFFIVNERRDTELPALQNSMTFPAKAWVKENGYLGLLGYDAVSGELVFASKSTTEGEFADWFKQLFLRKFVGHSVVGEDNQDKLEVIKQYLRGQNACLVFEVILPKHDPHIIKYSEDSLVLLDIVKRQAAFETLPDDEQETFAAKIGAPTKRLARTFASWADFQTWFESLKGLDYAFDGGKIEGFVIEDANRYHVKIKLDFYSFWKQLRGALDAIKAGKQPKIKQESEHPELAAEVITFMQRLPADDIAEADIIAVREKFETVTKAASR